MFDVGSTATLAVKLRDAENNPLDPADLEVSIRLPDGTTAGPFTPDGGDGNYGYGYVTEQAGRHVARWVGDGFAYSDVFNVWPEDPRFLISLDDAKGALRRRWSTSTVDDDDLRLYVASTTPVIEDIVGPVGAQNFTVTLDGGSPAIVLPHSGVQVVSVTVNGQEFTEYTAGNAAGILTYGTGYAATHWPRGAQNIVVTYTAGLAAVPPNVLLATREELRFLWQIGQQGVRPAFGAAAGADDTEVEFTPSGFAVPRRVIELCNPHARGPVVA